MRRALLAVLVLAWATPAHATTYTICSTGADYTTPAAYVAAVGSGASHTGSMCNEDFGAVAINSSKTYVNFSAGMGDNAVDPNHAVTPSHPVWDGGGVTGFALKSETGWWIMGVEIKNYTDFGRYPFSGTASWALLQDSYVHHIGNTTAESCWYNTADRAGTVAQNTVMTNCSGYGLRVNTAGSNYNSIERLSVIGAGNIGVLYDGSHTSDVVNNLFVKSAVTWGFQGTKSVVNHATIIGCTSGIYAGTINYSIIDGGSIGVCYKTALAENVVANTSNPWRTWASGCVSAGSGDAGSTTTPPTYYDTVQYKPCTGSSADGRSPASAVTTSLWGVTRTDPEDAGAAEAVSCGPAAGTRVLRVGTDGVRVKRVGTDGVRVRRVQ